MEGCLTPHTPQSEDMRLEPTLYITPEGSLTDIPTVMEREAIGTSLETAYMGLSQYTSKNQTPRIEKTYNPSWYKRNKSSRSVSIN